MLTPSHARRVPAWVVAAVAAPLLVLLFTGAPLQVLGCERLMGTGTPDLWGHTWHYAMAARSLGEGSLSLSPVPTLHPAGQAMWQGDPIVPWLLTPVALTLGAPAAYLVNVLAHLALVAGAMAWALERIEVPAPVAGALGLVVATSPFARGVVASGLPEVLAMGWLPAFAVLLYLGLGGRTRALVGAAVVGVLMVLDGLYAALPGAAVGAVVLGAALVRPGQGRGRVLLAGLGVGAAVGLAAVVAWLQYRGAGHGGISAPVLLPPLVAHDTGWVVAQAGAMDLLNPLVPAPLLPEAGPGTLHRHTTYLGWALLALAGVGAWRRPSARLWGGVALVALVVALGPRLVVAGRVWGADVALPGAAVMAVGAHHPYRLAGLASLCLVAMAAVPLGGWWSQGRRALVVGLVALVWVEGLALAPVELGATVPDPAGEVERWLRDVPGEGAVLDLPLDRECDRTRGPFPQRAFYQQAIHRRPIGSGLCGLPAVARAVAPVAALDLWILRAWQSGPWRGPIPPEGEVEGPPWTPPPLDLADPEGRGRAALAEAGYAWVWVDLQAVPPAAVEPLVAALDGWLGEPALTTADRRLYSVTRD